jgi:hypothetical protein
MQLLLEMKAMEAGSNRFDVKAAKVSVLRF